MAMGIPRRLAAILAADVASYTRLMELDEAGTVAAWRRARAEVIEPTVAAHGGRIVKLTGDGFLAEFPTVENAVSAALAMQVSFAELFADGPEDRRIAFRMGVNIGDIWVDADDIYGAGVNIAARLQTLAEPGGLCISGAVHDSVKHKIAAQFDDAGVQRVKNVAEPIRVWRVRSRASGGTNEPRTGAANRGGLAPMLAWPLLVFVLVGMLVIAVRGSDLTQLESSMLPLPPRVLAARAREILASAGHSTGVVDSYSWFAAEVLARDGSAVANAPVHAIRFISRESPTPLVPQNLFRIVTEDDPASSVPGMTSVTLASDGTLLRLNVTPGATAQAVPYSDWTSLFEKAGLNLSDFDETAVSRPAPTPHDREVAWVARDGAGVQTLVAAATADERLVYFEVSSPDSPSEYRAQGPFNTGASGLQEANIWVAVILAFGAAGLMARYNLRRGEGDRTHATRLAVFFVVTGVLSSVARGHHVPVALEELTFLFSVTGWSLVWGAFVWLLYIGLEPHVRRMWPGMLVSWTSLLSGRWRDPLVGRDILVGAAVGVALVLARFLFTGELPSNDLTIRALDSLRSIPAFLNAVLVNILMVPSHALGGLFFLLLMRGIFRNTWVAGAVVCVAFLPYVSHGTAFLSWQLGVLTLFICATVFALCLQVGLLAYASLLVTQFFLTRFPLTTDVNAWYFERSALILLLMGALATYGCVIALGPGMLSPDATQDGAGPNKYRRLLRMGRR